MRSGAVTTDRVAGAALVVIALFVLVESRRLPLGTLAAPGPAYMPVLLAIVLGVTGALLALLGGRAPRVATPPAREWRRAAAILAVCVFAALALERLGYRLTMGVALLFLLGVVERKSVVLTLVLAVALALGSFFLFSTLLRVPLPRGPFGL